MQLFKHHLLYVIIIPWKVSNTFFEIIIIVQLVSLMKFPLFASN